MRHWIKIFDLDAGGTFRGQVSKHLIHSTRLNGFYNDRPQTQRSDL